MPEMPELGFLRGVAVLIVWAALCVGLILGINELVSDDNSAVSTTTTNERSLTPAEREAEKESYLDSLRECGPSYGSGGRGQDC
jgi:hypothetical protein